MSPHAATSMDPRRRKLIEDHLVLVDHVVRRVGSGFPRHVERQELIAAGRLGLTEAASRFDFDRGGEFAPYAARRIRGAVLDLVRAGDWVPRSVRETARRADDVAVALRNDLGRPASDGEVAAKLGTVPGAVRAARSAAHHGAVGALDHHAGANREGPADTLVDDTVATIEEVLENRELHGYLRSALDLLPERLRMIVVGHYLDGRPLDELAALLGVTPSRVSQLRADAVEMLRDGLDAQYESTDPARPRGRVQIRQAQFAAAVAQNADWRSRLVLARYRSDGQAAGADRLDGSGEPDRLDGSGHA